VKKFLKRLPKWLRIVAWVIGIWIGLILILVIVAKTYLLTWKTYVNDDLGFKFRYPQNWHIIFELPPTKAQVDKNGETLFYIDSKEKLPNDPQDPVRSLGDVQVWIENNDSSLKAHELQYYYLKPSMVRYGKYSGYVSGNLSLFSSYGGLCKTTGTGPVYVGAKPNGCYLETLVLGKNVDIKVDNGHYFYLNTLSYTSDLSLTSRLKMRFYNWVGLKIVDSFNFTK
jgi:hypothetical protein